MQLGEFTTVVMKLDAGAGQVYSRNDMLLLSRDDPQVRRLDGWMDVDAVLLQALAVHAEYGMQP